MGQKPGHEVPLQERLAIQAELHEWRATLPVPERSHAAIARRVKVTPAMIGRVSRGDFGALVRDKILKCWKVTVPHLTRKHDSVIQRVFAAENPEQMLAGILGSVPEDAASAAKDIASAAVQAAEALAELDGVDLKEAKVLALDEMTVIRKPTPLEIYRAVRRRLASTSSSPTS